MTMNTAPIPVVVGSLLLNLSACTTYLGIATDKDGQRTYITYEKDFLFFGSSGVILCERQGDTHVCRKVEVWPVEGPAAVLEERAQHADEAMTRPVAPAPLAAQPSQSLKQMSPLPVKADRAVSEIVLNAPSALTEAATTLPTWQGSFVVLRLKDGRVVQGGLALVSGLDLRVRTEMGTWSGSLTEVEKLTRY